jgi:hypothetical protein
MTALALLETLRASDVRLSPKGDRLAFDAPAGVMTAELRALVANHKAEVLAVLAGDWYGAALLLISRETDTDRRAGLRYQFEERAGIAEYDGGMGRADAERTAYEEIARGHQ